jgi:hypothetical protein
VYLSHGTMLGVNVDDHPSNHAAATVAFPFPDDPPVLCDGFAVEVRDEGESVDDAEGATLVFLDLRRPHVRADADATRRRR